MVLQGNIYEIIKLDLLLFLGFLTIVYVFYDILFLEIPESILLIGNITVWIMLLGSDMGSMQILSTYPNIVLDYNTII